MNHGLSDGEQKMEYKAMHAFDCWNRGWLTFYVKLLSSFWVIHVPFHIQSFHSREYSCGKVRSES